MRRYPILRGTPSAGALNTQEVGEIGDFRAIFDEIPVYLANGAR